MQNYVLLTRLMHEECTTTFSIRRREKSVVAKVQEHIPEIKWVSNYAILGPWDYLDIFQAPDLITAMKLSALVRHYGAAYTEVWPAADWDIFEKAAQELSDNMHKNENK